MIERIVLVKLNEENSSEDGRRRVATHARRILPLLPGVESLTVGTPGDERCERSWDLSIIARFTRYEDVRPYLDNEDHRAFVDEFLAPRMEMLKAWNFDIGD